MSLAKKFSKNFWSISPTITLKRLSFNFFIIIFQEIKTQDFDSSKFAHVFSQKIFKNFFVNIANNHFKKAEA